MQLRAACTSLLFVPMLLIQGCAAISEYDFDAHYTNAETSESVSALLAPESYDRGLTIHRAWPKTWKETRRALLEGSIATTAPPIPHGRSKKIPLWFGRLAPGGEGMSTPLPARQVISSAPESQVAIRVSSWTWGDGLKLCWPTPVRTERVYFPVGAVEGGVCPADIVLDGEGWLIRSQLHDVGLDPQSWVDGVVGKHWTVDGWREKAGRLYLMISPVEGD